MQRKWNLRKHQLELNMKASKLVTSTEDCVNKSFWKENTQSAGLTAVLFQYAF